MNMILALDTMGSRYGKLPSEVIVNATTFDMVIMDAAMTYINEKQRQASGDSPNISLDDLAKFRKQVR
jgi:hypothetical protein